MKQLLCSILVCSAALVNLGWAQESTRDSRCYELRTYCAADGKLDELHGSFRDYTMRLFQKHGIANVGYWVPQDNKDNILIYMISFPSREARGGLWKTFLEDPDFKTAWAASKANGKLVEKIESVFLSATDFSPRVRPVTADTPRLFELRTYTTHPDKLDELLARFRDHTCALFEKHELPQFGYWTPMDEKNGSKNTLIYLLAHKDEAFRKAGFDAFRKDPDWQSARKLSEANGKLLVNKGVKSVFLVPTDYFPTK